MEAGLGAYAALCVKYRLLGDIRAARQHFATMGRPEHELELLWRGHPFDMVPGVQSIPDFLAGSTSQHILVEAVTTGIGAFKHPEDGPWVFSGGRGLCGHDCRRAQYGAGGAQKRSLACRDGLHSYYRRALFVAYRPLAGDEGRAGADSFDDDGDMVPVELFWQLLIGISRYLLGADAGGSFFPNAYRAGHGRGRSDLGARAAAGADYRRL